MVTSELNSEKNSIKLEGVRQNNLKNFNIAIPTGKFIAVSGVSGSGKSSFAVETLSAEGQRRYIETFSPYARQFMERIGAPQVDRVQSIPPSIVISQGNPVRTSRSTVASMTELADLFKVLFSRASVIVCRNCNRTVKYTSSQDAAEEVLKVFPSKTILITFPVSSGGFSSEEIVRILKNQGFGRVVTGKGIETISEDIILSQTGEIQILMDKVIADEKNLDRIAESIERSRKFGKGKANVIGINSDEKVISGNFLSFDSSLKCHYCSIEYSEPDPNFFSYNSPIGACPECKGFGKIIRIDPNKVIPDFRKSLSEGAIKPWTSGYSAECMEDLFRFAKREGIPLDVPYKDLGEEQKRVIWEGKGSWYGINGYFEYLEKKSYKMHFRVLLARYRSYLNCPLCGGGRFRPDVLVYKIAGKSIADVYSMTIKEALGFCKQAENLVKTGRSSQLVLNEIFRRLEYLDKVGLGYLELSRETRTLSGGEVGRVRLASSVGSNLSNTLYVLDEPTVGLHPCDTRNLLSILQELKERGNTVVVVEHDTQVLLSADILIDLGPGPGNSGGKIVYIGSPHNPFPPNDSLTMRYLTGKENIPVPSLRRQRDRRESIRITGACARNLANIDVEIPLGIFVCITGVSGSGKSTLIQEVLYFNLKNFIERKNFHPANCEGIEGWNKIDEVILIDQTPIASTPRANPATYTKLMNRIRNLMASSEMAKRQGMKPSFFSTNSGEGRCKQCGGTGFEKIQMQFLSDIYIKCRYCNGLRFKKEVLKVTVDGKNINDLLSMTIDEISQFLQSHGIDPGNEIKVLQKVGLGYLITGQPFTSLSAGEIQRIKLASAIKESRKRRRRLILMDEPTTGLHPHDVRLFVSLIQEMVDKGDSIVVIEHNMDVVKCADWVIDLGPGGGKNGGRIVAAGTPEEVSKSLNSKTAHFLFSALIEEKAVSKLKEIEKEYEKVTKSKLDNGIKNIQILGAKHNNLQGINVEIPQEKITAITGVSGSGKSSLAFDVLFAEGQRRFLDTLSPYVRQYLKQIPPPEVDCINNLPPVIAIEQRSSRAGIRSTVGTLTEIYPFLRLLFARAGIRHCPECKIPVGVFEQKYLPDEIIKRFNGEKIRILLPVVKGRKGNHRKIFEKLNALGFSRAKIDGRVIKIKPVPKLERYKIHFIDVVLGEIFAQKTKKGKIADIILSAGRVSASQSLIVVEGSGGRREIFGSSNTCPNCGKSFDQLDPVSFSFNSVHGACPKCKGLGLIGVKNEQEDEYDFEQLEEMHKLVTCPQCNGKRLKEEFLNVFIGKWNISDFCDLSIEDALKEIKKFNFEYTDKEITEPIIKEIVTRLEFLKMVGLSYLTLSRRAITLSGGESQRVKLASEMGSELKGVCYILDEPTIGLHPADSEMLRKILAGIRDKGNTIVVVEHDSETIRFADYCIELGPEGGKGGGRLIVEGSPEDLKKKEGSATSFALSNLLQHPTTGKYREIPSQENFIRIIGAKANNLKNIDVKIPLERFVCITGVSGSGKSSLLVDVIYENLRRYQNGNGKNFQLVEKIEGIEKIRGVKMVDQNPIGKTPRSTVATYVGFWDEIRKLFAMTVEARTRGFSASKFSFNLKEGSCEECKGTGFKKVRMSFLPLVNVVCETCGGKRYRKEVMEIKYRGYTISDIMNMTVKEALEFFSFHGKITYSLRILNETGLGYILLGQSSPALSGGEAQRIKLAAEIAWAEYSSRKGYIYLLEEPTTGLHTLDVAKLLKTLHKLVDSGGTVIVIEHNMDVIADADWIIDLGPGSGDNGGMVVAEGRVSDVLKKANSSKTAYFLKRYLNL